MPDSKPSINRTNKKYSSNIKYLCHNYQHQLNVLLLVFLIISLFGSALANVKSKITCEDDQMVIQVMGGSAGPITGAYLEGLKDYPDSSCIGEKIGESHVQFRLSLKEFYRCGTSKILNKITGIRTFYNRVIVVQSSESGDGKEIEYHLLAKCQQGSLGQNFNSPIEHNHINYNYTFEHNGREKRQIRDSLPAGFQEPDSIAIFGEREGRAPEPMLNMLVRQDGRIIGQELLVQPGAPLTMEVTLDQKSKDIYGILVSHLDVTDTGAQSEVIVLNGCSVDPYLFENFLTNDGDLLAAKFRAFKFPDTNYVLFRGTVNVCLGSCQGVECSNRQIGYGRRKRAVDMHGGAKNRVYEVQMTTILRIANSNGSKDHGRAILGSTIYKGNEAKQTREQPGIADLVITDSAGSISLAQSGVLSSSLLLFLIISRFFINIL